MRSSVADTCGRQGGRFPCDRFGSSLPAPQCDPPGHRCAPAAEPQPSLPPTVTPAPTPPSPARTASPSSCTRPPSWGLCPAPTPLPCSPSFAPDRAAAPRAACDRGCASTETALRRLGTTEPPTVDAVNAAPSVPDPPEPHRFPSLAPLPTLGAGSRRYSEVPQCSVCKRCGNSRRRSGPRTPSPCRLLSISKSGTDRDPRRLLL